VYLQPNNNTTGGRLSHMIKGFFYTAALLCASMDAFAANWPQWRGPNFNGSTEESNLPITWSTTENVVWTTPLPGQSGSTPIVWENSVFLASPDNQKNLNLICVNRKDGKIRWQNVVAVGDKTEGRNNMSSPSPVTDGKSVFVLFGTSDLAAFDFDGKELWKRNLGKDYGKFAIMWIYGSSPLLFGGRLYIQVLQRNPAPPDYPGLAGGSPERPIDVTSASVVEGEARRTPCIQCDGELATANEPMQHVFHLASPTESGGQALAFRDNKIRMRGPVVRSTLSPTRNSGTKILTRRYDDYLVG